MPLPDARAPVVEGVRFPAGPYLLEGELAYDEAIPSPRGGVVVAGSHPLLGGNMQNNVVRGLGDGLAERGLVTLRFNYRGVGRSQGPPVDVARHMAEFWATSHVPGEMELGQDVQAAAAYLRQVIGPDVPLVLVGYSFGCALLGQVRLARAPAARVLVAPPLGKHGCEELTSGRCPTLVIVSEDDFSLDRARLRSWFDRLPPGRRLVETRGDNHFFRGQEAWLVDTVETFLNGLEVFRHDGHP